MSLLSSGGSRLGQGGTPHKSCPAPRAKFLIGSIVISLSRCCLRNDEGPGPRIFSPRTATATQYSLILVLRVFVGVTFQSWTRGSLLTDPTRPDTN